MSETTKLRKFEIRFIYFLAIILLGALAGIFCWVFFFLMDYGVDIIWRKIPEAIGANHWWWPIPICLIGGVVIGFVQSKWTGQPETMDQVLRKVKKTGRYEYKHIFVGFFAALIPLLFCASIGP